ncbi:MAG: hypothetical protein ACRBN8_22750 [Nannocystales bacterium]
MKMLLAMSMGTAPAPEEPESPDAESGLAPAPPTPPPMTTPVAGPARDDEASAVNLVWDAPADECSDAAAMQARLDEAMTLELSDDVATRKRWVIARVRKTGEEWTLRLWVAPEGGLSERALSESSCAELERATLTIVAMLMPPVTLDPNPKSPPKPEDMKPPVATEQLGDEELDALIGDAPADEKPPPDPGGPDMEAPSASKLRAAIGFAGGVGSGTMPATAGGLEVTGALLFRGGRIEAVGNFWGTRNIGLDAAENARARYNLLSAAFRGCGAPRVGPVELTVCGGVEGGSILANVDGATLLHGPGQPFVLMQLTTGANVVLAPSVALTFDMQGWLSPIRARHQALDTTLSTGSLFGYRFLAGAEFRFGFRRKARAFERKKGAQP